MVLPLHKFIRVCPLIKKGSSDKITRTLFNFGQAVQGCAIATVSNKNRDLLPFGRSPYHPSHF